MKGKKKDLSEMHQKRLSIDMSFLKIYCIYFYAYFLQDFYNTQMNNPEKSNFEDDFINMSMINQDSLSISHQESELIRKQLQDMEEEVKLEKEKNRLYRQNIQSFKKLDKKREENSKYLKIKKEKLQAKLEQLTAENTALKAANTNSAFLETIPENSTLHQQSSEELQEQKTKSARLSQKIWQLEATIEKLMKSASKEPKMESVNSQGELAMKLQSSILENDSLRREINQLKKEHQMLKKDLTIACKGRNVIQRKYKEIINQKQSLRMSLSQLSPNKIPSELSTNSSLFRKKFVDIESDETDEDSSIRMNSQHFYIFAELRDHLSKISRQSDQINFLNMVSAWSDLEIGKKEVLDDTD